MTSAPSARSTSAGLSLAVWTAAPPTPPPSRERGSLVSLDLFTLLQRSQPRIIPRPFRRLHLRALLPTTFSPRTVQPQPRILSPLLFDPSGQGGFVWAAMGWRGCVAGADRKGALDGAAEERSRLSVIGNKATREMEASERRGEEGDGADGEAGGSRQGEAGYGSGEGPDSAPWGAATTTATPQLGLGHSSRTATPRSVSHHRLRFTAHLFLSHNSAYPIRLNLDRPPSTHRAFKAFL